MGRWAIVDYEYAKRKIDELIRALDDVEFEYSHTSGDEARDEEARRAAARRLQGRLELATRVVEAIDPELASKFEMATKPRTLAGLAEVARSLFDEHEELLAAIGEVGPRLAAEALHPMVWDSARSLWQTEHRRQAVEAAANAVNAMLQAKLGSRQLSGAKLANEAFSRQPASEEHPRLRFPGTSEDVDRDTWTSRHEGARSFAVGCFMALRNLAAHGDEELPEQLALEQLAAFSILARWIDEAVRT